jgi:hypothetical protein
MFAQIVEIAEFVIFVREFNTTEVIHTLSYLQISVIIRQIPATPMG